MNGRVLRFPQRSIAPEELESSAARALATPAAERAARAEELRLEEPDLLLAVCGRVRGSLEAAPASAYDEASFFYDFLLRPNRQIGLFDEREYFLAEFSLVAGTACRQLSRRDEARLWFERAEACFLHTVNAVADLSRVAYQRLALRIEERQIDAVLELVPIVIDSFRRLGMSEDALKTRFLEGLAFMESERLDEAVAAFREIAREADALGSARLLASAYGNLTHVYGMLGDTARAIEASRQAIPALRRLNDRVGLAKVQWGVARLLRETNQIVPAIEAYRAAQEEFEQIGMRADVAALHLVLADLLLEVGEESAARQSVLEAMPVIGELNMVPEGMAALRLLRDSLRGQRLDRPALRELHGYFEELR